MNVTFRALGRTYKQGIYGKGKDRAVEPDLLDDGGTGEGEGRVGKTKQSGNALS